MPYKIADKETKKQITTEINFITKKYPEWLKNIR
jgi:hypothetical protein